MPLTNDNAEERIQAATKTILDSWDDWDGEAGQDAQVAQDHRAYVATMTAKIEAVLFDMVFGR